MLDRTAIQDFFTTYGQALAAGDLDGIAACYSYPAYVAGDAQSLEIGAPNEVKDAFSGAAEQYHRRGLFGAVPEVRAAEALTDSLVWADVRWSYTDRDDVEQEASTFRYVLRVTAESVRICVVVAAAVEA
ncbi:hypothetical protein [Streptomonospora litoralis]|uniref:SnoaL-like domain-containing protein n=1 Tax=Streptomonospora litoralis TaxID=2498135 RepID=A0A4P6Q2I9_9ACTN|nr:hypothetical protein [Streptomonospora litoralis]QBI52994.1 hypothetical protein EKD16_05970 [Streptomonospora litoralis]